MSKRRIVVGATLLGALVASTLAAAQLPANADGAPQAKDVVGVGSDVMQTSVNFLADGFGVNLGYNSAGNKNRLISFDSTGDANGRKLFTDPALGTSSVLNSSVALRAGTSPVQRPNGGNVGLEALVADGKDGVSANRISFARSPNLPTQTQQNSAQANLGTLLHTVRIGTDIDYIATASTTNAPAALSGTDLVKIYTGVWTTWGQIPGYNGTAEQKAQTIKPLIPQNGAGMRNIFLNALKPFNGNATVNPTAATEVQQNDPSAITTLDPAVRVNAIVPFPKGRFDLLNSGYFRNPNTPYSAVTPAAALNTDGISLITSGTAGDGTDAFTVTFPYYIVFRQSDFESTEAWQPGGTLNWVRTLFFNPGIVKPYVDTAPGKALLTAAGITPAFQDRGNTVG